jgi:hypothetical protein
MAMDCNLFGYSDWVAIALALRRGLKPGWMGFGSETPIDIGNDPPMAVGGGMVAYGNPFPTLLATLPTAAISPLAIDRRL